VSASLVAVLTDALSSRAELFDPKHEAAFRLFNGFTEGCPALVADLYAATLVLHNYADPSTEGHALIAEAQAFFLEHLPWLRAIVVKTRNAHNERERNGVQTHGATTDLNRWVREHGVRYAIDPMMNRDASLYLDTRNLRAWAMQHLRDKTVLNTFAYTGSLGVAALAGGAKRMVQLDLNRQFLNVAKTSYTLNGYPINKSDFVATDFWTNRFKRTGELFDCVFLDPPFFATTPMGTVNLASNATKLINKVRPVIADGGWLVAINNALFVSGADYLHELEALCADGYLSIETLVPVPEDFMGYPSTRVTGFITDPAPFNHPTKIAVLRVRRKA